MKYGTWIVLVAALTFVIVFFLKPPILLFMGVGIPILTIVLTMAAFAFSFRKTLQYESVPERGNEDRIRALDAQSAEWERMGFTKCDGFFLKMIPDSITYVYKHRQVPAYGCVYHFGAKMSCDIITLLRGNRSLTTNNSRDAGNIPRPSAKMLQVFPGGSLGYLWEEHQRATAFVNGKGLAAVELPLADFRPYFFKDIQEFKDYVLGLPLWPVKLVYWVITRYGRNYCRRVEDQFRSGFLPAEIPTGKNRGERP